MLCVIGLIALLYYGLLCYPVIAQKSKVPSYDVEQRYLLPLSADHNDNNEAAPAVPVVVPTAQAEPQGTRKSDECYPSVPNSSQSPHEDDSFGSADVSQEVSGSKQRLDEPDCAYIPIVKKEGFPPREGKGQNRSESVPLLHGDEEDGLILCQPSSVSKNSGQHTPSNETDASPSEPTADILQNGNDSPCKSNLQPVSVPIDIQVDPSQQTSSVIQLPDHTAVTISEPIKIPPQENMSVSHPPLHMIVSIPQPLNAPPLMVAPIYDEPPIDQSPVCLQQPLHSIVVPVNVIPPPIELETYQETTPVHRSDAYGWKDHEEVPVIVKTETDQLLETDQPQKLSQEELLQQESPREPAVALTAAAVPMTVSAVRPAPQEVNDGDCGESSDTSSNASPAVSPRSKGSCTLSESSEPELNEYTFETGRKSLTITTVIENEIGSASNVQILRYTRIDDSVGLEGDASVSDSMRVLVGDPVDLDDLQTESMKDSDVSGKVSPEPNEQGSAPVQSSSRTIDLAIARRSPDGDSMKSDEEDESVGSSSHKKKGQSESTVDDSPQKKSSVNDSSQKESSVDESLQKESSVDDSSQKQRT